MRFSEWKKTRNARITWLLICTIPGALLISVLILGVIKVLVHFSGFVVWLMYIALFAACLFCILAGAWWIIGLFCRSINGICEEINRRGT